MRFLISLACALMKKIVARVVSTLHGDGGERLQCLVAKKDSKTENNAS